MRLTKLNYHLNIDNTQDKIRFSPKTLGDLEVRGHYDKAAEAAQDVYQEVKDTHQTLMALDQSEFDLNKKPGEVEVKDFKHKGKAITAEARVEWEKYPDPEVFLNGTVNEPGKTSYELEGKVTGQGPHNQKTRAFSRKADGVSERVVDGSRGYDEVDFKIESSVRRASQEHSLSKDMRRNISKLDNSSVDLAPEGGSVELSRGVVGGRLINGSVAKKSMELSISDNDKRYRTQGPLENPASVNDPGYGRSEKDKQYFGKIEDGHVQFDKVPGGQSYRFAEMNDLAKKGAETISVVTDMRRSLLDFDNGPDDLNPEDGAVLLKGAQVGGRTLSGHVTERSMEILTSDRELFLDQQRQGASEPAVWIHENADGKTKAMGGSHRYPEGYVASYKAPGAEVAAFEKPVSGEFDLWKIFS